MTLRHLADIPAPARAEFAKDLGLQPMRVRQVANHYFARLTSNPDQMTDLPAGERAGLAQQLVPQLLRPGRAQVADAGATRKQLFHLDGGAAIETVTMAYPDRITVCVSSQAGCGIGCPFCATGKMGLIRNLTAAEIVEQVRLAAALAQSGQFGPDFPERLGNVVFMGMGEPLANFQPLAQALTAITAPPPDGFGISARKVTVSTCGLVGGIGRLAQLGLPVRLALSLHAPDDAARDRLVPINRRFPIQEVLEAAHGYYRATGRRVSVEYALIRDINDQRWRASLLARRLCQYGTEWVHVNPIPLNPVPGSEWTASRPEREAEFVHQLRAAGLTVTLRDTRGREVDGACGQLAAKEETD
jgi:23S rRNA (adenine2503-C2)-methyltransferase